MNYKYKHQLFKYKQIAFGIYKSFSKTDTVLIYGLGAPVLPDNGLLEDAHILADGGIDVIVPDYLGYGRSDGKFTPRNCIKTFAELHKGISKGLTAKNYYYDTSVNLKYKRIIFLGRSFGGAFVPLLPKYTKNIKEMILLFPAADQAAQGEVQGEETNQQFMDSMLKDGYHHLYRGILDDIWWENLENRDGLSPMDNLKDLKGVRLLIVHGKKDKCIHYSKSVDYFKKLKKVNPESVNDYKLILYSKGEHGRSTSVPAMNDILKWIKMKNY